MQRIIECSGLSDYRDQSPSIFLLDPETVESHCAVWTKPLARRTLRVRCARATG